MIQKGSMQVKIYRCMNKGRVNYFVCYYLGQMRKRTVFNDFEKAKKEAKFVAGKLDKQETMNMAEVSFESGTAPQMVHRHYKALVSAAEAKEWFSITPEVVAQKKLQLLKISEPSVTDRALQPPAMK